MQELAVISPILEDVSKAPFKSLGHALSFYNGCNPARARSVNLLEPERGQKPVHKDFSGYLGGAPNPNDLWASITLAIAKVMKPLDHNRKWAFLWRNIGDKERHLAAEDIAKRLHTSTSTVWRYLREVNEDLEKEFLRRYLIEAPEDYND